MADFGVVFDCDGTLLDTIGVWHEAEAELFRRAGAEQTPEDHALIVTYTLPEVGVFFHEKFGLGSSSNEVTHMLDDLLLEYYETKATAKPGALELVQALAAAGVPMSVASSSPQAFLQAGLSGAGFAPYLTAIVSVDDVGASKREPAVYDRAREAFGFDRAHTWGFEDSLYAVRTLKRAGYPTIGVYDCDESGTFADLQTESDMVVRSLAELTVDRLDCELKKIVG